MSSVVTARPTGPGPAPPPGTQPRPGARRGGRLVYAGRASRAIARDPFEGLERTIERVAEWRENTLQHWVYRPSEGWEARLHRQLGVPWPCPETAAFAEVWQDTRDGLRARGLALGRGAFGGWDDADAGLARAAWCLARHRRPEVVVETGVARGLTTRVLLEALERNGAGRLWSIDLAPLIERDLSDETGLAVPADLRRRWTLLRGSSRRCLPALVTGLPGIDLFLHDSMHTARNVRFELDQVWPALRGGAALVDDVERNVAFGRFTRAHPEADALLCPADDGRALFGCLLRDGGA
jgi:predicted O-methyltransferase YrrM